MADTEVEDRRSIALGVFVSFVVYAAFEIGARLLHLKFTDTTAAISTCVSVLVALIVGFRITRIVGDARPTFLLVSSFTVVDLVLSVLQHASGGMLAFRFIRDVLAGAVAFVVAAVVKRWADSVADALDRRASAAR